MHQFASKVFRNENTRPLTRGLAIAVFAFASLSTMDNNTQAQSSSNGNLLSGENASETGVSNGNGLGLGNANANRGNQTCTIIVTQPGTLGSGIGNKELSSKIFGGTSGGAQVTTSTGSFSLNLDAPLGFSNAPTGGNSNVTMTTSFLGNGATNFSESPGNVDIRLRNGTTVVETHLAAVRTDGNPFPAGYYSAELTLRCE